MNKTTTTPSSSSHSYDPIDKILPINDSKYEFDFYVTAISQKKKNKNLLFIGGFDGEILLF